MAKAKEAKELEERVIFLTDQLKRALADYSNLEKRVFLEQERNRKNANLSLIAKILPLLDYFEKAAVNLNDEGLNLGVKEFKKCLEAEGVKEITLKSFDPNKHEAVDIMIGKEEGKIVEVVEKGYELNGVLIRPAKVKIVKND